MPNISKRTRTVEIYGGEAEAKISELQARLDAALHEETQNGAARMSTKSPLAKLAKEFDELTASTEPEAVLTLTEIPRHRVRDITDECPPREGKWQDRANGMDYDKYLGLLFVAMASQEAQPDWSEEDRAAFWEDLGQAGYDKVRKAIEEITDTEVDVPKFSAASVVNLARENIKRRSSLSG